MSTLAQKVIFLPKEHAGTARESKKNADQYIAKFKPDLFYTIWKPDTEIIIPIFKPEVAPDRKGE